MQLLACIGVIAAKSYFLLSSLGFEVGSYKDNSRPNIKDLTSIIFPAIKSSGRKQIAVLFGFKSKNFCVFLAESCNVLFLSFITFGFPVEPEVLTTI